LTQRKAAAAAELAERSLRVPRPGPEMKREKLKKIRRRSG